MNEKISQRAQALESSKIRQIAEIGMRLDNVIPLYFGEGYWPTNPLICQALVESVHNHNHKYQPNNGAANLREAICAYSNLLFDSHIVPQQITVTPSGMQGLMLAAEVLVTPGDTVIAIEPGWPNIIGSFKAMGAQITSVPLNPVQGHWHLDIETLLGVLQPGVKALVINSPNNPTGWTMSAEDQSIVLKHCRKHGIWIVADDVYNRLYRHGSHAPSFLSIAEPDELLISVNSFSKAWSMTGWRLGWMVTPPELEASLGQLTEFNTSSTPGFIQDSGIVALQISQQEITDLCEKIKRGYDIMAHELGKFSRVEFVEPDGAFYSFFRVDGLTDSLQAATRIIDETGVGLAPGIAFGKQGEGYLR